MTVEKGEDLENQPDFSPGANSVTPALVSLDPHPTPKALGALRPFPSSGVSENSKKTWIWKNWIWKTWIWKTDFPILLLLNHQ